VSVDLCLFHIVSNTLFFCSVGPDPLTRYTLIPNNTNVIPTVTDNLFGQGLIEQQLIAVSFEPLNSTSETNGELTFGSIDSSKFTEPITYLYVRAATWLLGLLWLMGLRSPLTKTAPSSFFWGIDASLQYGNGNGNGSVNILNTTAGIVDTGTTLLGLSTGKLLRD
jgi:cathepsin E